MGNAPADPKQVRCAADAMDHKGARQPGRKLCLGGEDHHLQGQLRASHPIQARFADRRDAVVGTRVRFDCEEVRFPGVALDIPWVQTDAQGTIVRKVVSGEIGERDTTECEDARAVHGTVPVHIDGSWILWGVRHRHGGNGTMSQQEASLEREDAGSELDGAANMGIRNFLNQLLEPDSSFPEDAAKPPMESAAAAEGTPGKTKDFGHARILADVVRAVGEGCFDMGEEKGETIRERFDDLARAIDSGDAKLQGLPEGIASHRRRERHWVTKNLRDMAETVVGLITRLSRNVSLDRSSNSRVGDQLLRLRGAVDHDDLSTMRKEILSAVDTIGIALKERDDRQRSEMEAISRQLVALKNELTHTRKEMALDGLTRLYNRASLDEHMESVASISVLSGREACLLMVDIDHFKNVNDTWGHQAGDAVLRGVADLLVKSFPRKSDFVGRYGGEEFAVVLGEDGAPTARMLSERLLERIRTLVVVWEGNEIRSTVSIGIAQFGDGDGVKDWIDRADKALYQAKAEGRDRIVEAD